MKETTRAEERKSCHVVKIVQGPVLSFSCFDTLLGVHEKIPAVMTITSFSPSPGSDENPPSPLRSAASSPGPSSIISILHVPIRT